MGDSTDGYKGCPGCGPKSAEAILQKAGDPWENVLQAYRSAFAKDKDPSKSKWLDRTPEDLALLNALLARILRVGDWDRSEEHTSELQSLMRISYAVFCLKKKKIINR